MAAAATARAARPAVVGVVAVGALLLAADTLLQVGSGSWPTMLPVMSGRILRRASGGGVNATTAVSAEGEGIEAKDALARFRIDLRTSSAFHTFEQWAHRTNGGGGSGDGEATIEEAVVEARRVQHAVQVQLARLNAQAALVRTYLGVGGAGGDKRVVLWLRLSRADGDHTGATAVSAISKMRDSLPLSLEVESGWSLEGARVLPPYTSLVPDSLTRLALSSTALQMEVGPVNMYALDFLKILVL